MWHQQQALIRRCGIIIMRKPLRSFIRFIAWPGFILSLAVWLMNNTLNPYSKADFGYIMLLPECITMLTIFFIYWFADLLINDKASEMKKLMLSMGLRRFDYYCANSICLQLYVMPVSLAIATIVKVYLLDDTVSWPVVLMLHILFALHLDSATSFLVSFITSPIFSALFPVLIFLEYLIVPLTQYALKHSDEVYKPLILGLSAISPYQPKRLFYNHYLNEHEARPKDLIMRQDWPGVFIAQIVWIILLRSFAYWFEEVCPWQRVSTVLGPCFCFENREDRYENIDDSVESIAITSKYFEHRARDKEVGIKISGVTKVFNSNPALSDVSFSIYSIFQNKPATSSHAARNPMGEELICAFLQRQNHRKSAQISSSPIGLRAACDEVAGLFWNILYKGETTLLLGHNGAGKTTLMNIILGMLNPDAGNVRIKKRMGGVASVGVCPQSSILDNNLSVRQHLELFNDIKSNLSGRERDLHILETINDVSLASHADKQPEELSGGMRRKLSLGIAFVGKSDVLILDEPSSGLDPDSRIFVWNAIRRYRADRTVLLSTQHMEEADYLGDRIAIMSGGQIVCCGSSVYLNKLFGTGYKLRIECKPSKRQEILDHIRGYFDDARPEEGQEGPARPSLIETNTNFVVELRLRRKDDDAELQLIRLLQDIEIDSSTLGVHSYGLKSSSIEDVMLNSSKYFSTSQAEEAAKSVTYNDLSDTMVMQHQTRLGLIRALCLKQLQVYRVHWKLVILLKILLPISCTFDVLWGTNRGSIFWQSPASVLMVGHFVYFPTKEQVSKFKIMQLQSGAPVWLYWLSQLIVDSLSVIICLVSINIVLAILLEGSFLVPELHVHLLVSLATLLFCLASILFSYTLSTVLSSADTSYGTMVLIFAMSFIVSVPSRFLELMVSGDLWKLIDFLLDYLFLPFVPGDAYTYLLSGLATNCYLGNPEEICVPEPGLTRIMIGFSALVFHILLYTALLCLIERQNIDFGWYLRYRNIIGCIMRRPAPVGGTMLGATDNDVQAETDRALVSIKSPTSTYNSLTAAKLNKSYHRDTRVIQDLSFTVKKGECFGLLGVNGAGKTTTFSMLASETPPDSGRILANGHYLDQGLSKYRSMIGYDPQSNPAVSLTVYQALSLMASLRGIDQSCKPAIIKSITDLLEMGQHIDKVDSELSGGTKRKLALGMALIGHPSILMLDEPTAGVDPFARRGVWQLLKSVRARGNVSVVISSHAMEECEAICDRISIMASGRLRCIGTFLHLRSKFAKGCTLRVQFSSGSNEQHSFDRSLDGPPTGKFGEDILMRRQPSKPSAHVELDNMADAIVPELKQLLDSAIGPESYKLADKNATSLTFRITDNQVKRSILFKTMREFRQKHSNVSYMINDSSLEDIFITLAREQQQD